jgi:ADP-ribose pyrophosphatase YjhB (NUDIX family)
MLWVINAKFVATVAAVVQNDDGEVLLFHHTYRRSCPWGLPGGWLKQGEDPAAAIAREIQEESGLAVRGLRPLWVGCDRRYPRLDVVFTAELAGGTFRPSDEVTEARFFSPSDLPRVTPGTLVLIEAAREDHAGASGATSAAAQTTRAR